MERNMIQEDAYRNDREQSPLNGSAFEFLIWFLIVLVIFYAVNEYGGLKRFASAIVAFLIASIVIFFAYQGDLLSEVFITATFLILALFGLSAVFRLRRSDFLCECTENHIRRYGKF